MKTNFKQRLLSGLLAFVMILGMIPATAFAAEKAEIVTDLPEEHLTQGRMIDSDAVFICGIEYNCDGGIYNVDLYPVASDALKERYPVGKDVTSWFDGGLPEGLTALISGYGGMIIGQSHMRPYIKIGICGIPTETTAGRAVTITVPGDFYQYRQPVSFHSEIIIDPIGSACDGCAFKTINGMQVCYKEGMRVRQKAIVQHDSIKLIPSLQASNIAEERTAALCCKIKGFGKSERLTSFVYHSVIHL